MKIEFRKVPYPAQEFEVTDEKLLCKGTFFKESNKIVSVEIDMHGICTVDCAICGEEFDLDVAETIKLKVCDGISEDENLDMIECQDHMVDFDGIVDGEIASIKSDYHYCKNCKNEGE
jgi:hypothetical protein